jgi:hypothetical protein
LSSGSSCVTSLRLPPVSVQASGIQRASTRRWCLEPFLALSTGLGPVSEPPFSPVRGSSRRPRATTRAHPPLAVQRAAGGADAPRHRPSAIRRGGGSRSSPSRAELERQVPPGDPRVQHEQDPLQRLPARQPLATRKPEASLHRGNSGSMRCRSSSDTIHGAVAIGTPLSLMTDADGVRRQRAGPFIPIRVLNRAERTSPQCQSVLP